MVRSVLAVGPNPALQRVLAFDQLALGGVNRASALTTYVGGKGQGAALAARLWAPDEEHAVAQFLGGDSGRYVETELGAAGLATITQPVSGPTRICTTLLHDGGVNTELIDPSDPVSAEELSAMAERIGDVMGSYGTVALCGTQPPGAEQLYEKLAAAMVRAPAAAGAPEPLLLLDGFKQVEGVLGSGRLDVLKLNLDELKALTSRAEAREAASSLLHGSGARLTRPGAVLAVTDGPRPAYLFQGRAAWTLKVPSLQAVNAIGAGDVCTGVFAAQLAAARRAAAGGTGPITGDVAADAFAWGLAAASARVTNQLPTFEPERVRELRGGVVIEPLAWDSD
jgi:fructose-1-phosphate kinase PfkB-like protein